MKNKIKISSLALTFSFLGLVFFTNSADACSAPSLTISKNSSSVFINYKATDGQGLGAISLSSSLTPGHPVDALTCANGGTFPTTCSSSWSGNFNSGTTVKFTASASCKDSSHRESSQTITFPSAPTTTTTVKPTVTTTTIPVCDIENVSSKVAGGVANKKAKPKPCVKPKPIVDIKIKDATGTFVDGSVTVNYNDSTALSWSATNAKTCSLSSKKITAKPVGLTGESPVDSVQASDTFTLSCTGDGGSVSDSVTVAIKNSEKYANLANVSALISSMEANGISDPKIRKIIYKAMFDGVPIADLKSIADKYSGYPEKEKDQYNLAGTMSLYENAYGLGKNNSFSNDDKAFFQGIADGIKNKTVNIAMPDMLKDMLPGLAAGESTGLKGLGDAIFFGAGDAGKAAGGGLKSLWNNVIVSITPGTGKIVSPEDSHSIDDMGKQVQALAISAGKDAKNAILMNGYFTATKKGYITKAPDNTYNITLGDRTVESLPSQEQAAIIDAAVLNSGSDNGKVKNGSVNLNTSTKIPADPAILNNLSSALKGKLGNTSLTDQSKILAGNGFVK
jgi:hypothetical protein